MRRGIFCILCTAVFALSACGTDVDVILQKEDSASSYEEEEALEPESAEAAERADSEQDPAEKTNAVQEDAEVTDAVQDTAESEDVIFVYICGAVKEPGVYELPDKSRVFALVEQAGGLTDDADATSVNLAEVLQDGEMVFIPTEEESAAGVAAIVSKEPDAAEESTGGKVNINTADVAELTSLNGIGESKAQAIVAYREEHGAFSSIEEIMNVSGIAEGTFEKIKENITIKASSIDD